MVLQSEQSDQNFQEYFLHQKECFLWKKVNSADCNHSHYLFSGNFFYFDDSYDLTGFDDSADFPDSDDFADFY